MKVILLTVGDELLIGQVLNTNAAWLGEQLGLIGAEVIRSTALPDDVDALVAALDAATADADLVVVTGGLGPTHDDVTREALARHAGVELVLNEDVLAAIRERFGRRGRTMPEANAVQALIPDGFEVMTNPVGTAPGMWKSRLEGGRRVMLAVMPGVPHEMRHLTLNELIPRLRQEAGLRVIRHRTLLTAGIGESHLQERIGDLSAFLTDRSRLAYLPGPEGVRLRITVVGDDEAGVTENLTRFERHLMSRIGSFVYGRDGETIESVAGRLLASEGLRLAVAESCTGGSLLDRITNVPGASGYLIGGVVAYCNEVKKNVLGVSAEALEQEGAVSETVARQMAEGVRRVMATDIGLSTTGIAGPGGGTPEKPVGLVWIGYADADGSEAVVMQFGSDRELNKQLAATAALNLVRKRLLARSRETSAPLPAHG
ncbi:MAG TPA: competence/damage-inducible protein A [Rhodothermales bacterium]